MKPLQASKSIDSNGNLVLARKCRVTEDPVSVPVTLAEYHRWQGGELVQEVWPNLPSEQREFIQTGWTQAEWESIFSDSDEEDEVDQEALDREREAHESMLQRHDERRPQRARDLEDDLLNRRRPFA